MALICRGAKAPSAHLSRVPFRKKKRFCICNQQQNLPNSELLLEKVPKRIAWQNFYPANSLNLAKLHKCINFTRTAN